MKVIDKMSFFIGLVFGMFIKDDEVAPVSKTLSAHSDLLLMLQNEQDVGVHSQKIGTIYNFTRVFKNAIRNSFQEFHSVHTLRL